jgi:hypothetical protein
MSNLSEKEKIEISGSGFLTTLFIIFMILRVLNIIKWNLIWVFTPLILNAIFIILEIICIIVLEVKDE